MKKEKHNHSLAFNNGGHQKIDMDCFLTFTTISLCNGPKRLAVAGDG